MEFQGIQVSKTYQQINLAAPKEVFPLLCPVREKDWLDGWDYTMIHSESGLIEEGCVFSTPHHGQHDTIWYVTVYDKINFKIEFVRVTPEEEVVRINIRLNGREDGTTTSRISYQYTALNDQKNEWLKTKFEDSFRGSMIWWEKAINHYLRTGEMLKK
ncbi:hypothetical protein [Prolixibacter denitrificans]|uniref:Activator of Hsp90 ATPase-like protein n=1 Tax=Prolixibacter denitrificans TaxID=1541063 RepID=A0A2P8C713_9BACT|nr:hypothetical protein [Prolixibacter denitrificans]PSK80746.1 hypothetical protein CLV93_11340 [Prolixibacter denitrificans]GET22455.1 hypothetical protein JCM18694_27010 [Prolixibacter denitrificans]